MFRKYDNKVFEALRKQHNIFVLVGNGFDISILKKFKKGKMRGKTTSYSDFFDYITFFKLVEENNVLYEKMKIDKAKKKENWSDFENTINELISNNAVNLSVLEKSIDEFQGLFTKFLNDLVDSNTLLNLNDYVVDNKLSIQTLSEFLKDLDNLDKIKFKDDLSYYDLFYFVFANFNYTSLLDNYIFTDKSQFDPHKYLQADRNFNFKYIIPNRSETNNSTYLIQEVIHPHGVQDIPRSILFGIDLKKYDKGTDRKKRFVKGYWGQYEAKYKSYIESANLFIIYGMSLGISDAWWMDNIVDQILKRDVELIIYYRNSNNTYSLDYVKEKFLNCCIRHDNLSENEKDKIFKNIHVVLFSKNNTYFLGLENKTS